MSISAIGFHGNTFTEKNENRATLAVGQIPEADYKSLKTYIKNNQVVTSSETIFDRQYQENDPLAGRSIPKRVLFREGANPPAVFKKYYKKSNNSHLNMWERK